MSGYRSGADTVAYIQPSATRAIPPPNVTVVQVQPTVRQTNANGRLPVGSVYGHRDWSSGLFGCCNDCGVMCYVLNCYCLPVCDIATRTGECCCLPYIIPDALVPMRARIRTLGGIRGSIFNDVCALTCCHLCAVC